MSATASENHSPESPGPLSPVPMTGGPLVLSELFPDEVAERLGLQPYQGRQIFQWLHRKRVFDFEEMTDLSKELRLTLAERCVATELRVAEKQASSKSSTTKILFDLHDGESVEAVLIRDRRRLTLCISSQVGCALQCSFCATGEGGYARNLSAGEIVSQVLFLLRSDGIEGLTPNIVYMGMGEAFRNYDETMKSIRILMAKNGLGLGSRRITVSTVGEVPGIERFAEEGWQVRLSLSLHAANDKLRDKLVPLNRKYDLKRLWNAIHSYQARTTRQVTIEWTLLEGINDSVQDAEQLVQWAAGLEAHVNLIPYNNVPGLNFAAPASKERLRFRDALVERGMSATLRAERGGDIDAACGQLRRATQTPR